MADERGERTAEPTPKRLGEARDRGQIPRTAEAGAAMGILAAAGFLTWSGTSWLPPLVGLLELTRVELSPAPWTLGHAEEVGRRLLGAYVTLAAPPMLAVAGCAAAIHAIQARGVLSAYPLRPRWDMLNPIAGLRRIFGASALVELGKAPIKLALLGVIAFVTMRPALASLMMGAGQSPLATLTTVGELLVTLLWRLGFAHAALAALDYGYQRWSHRRQLRMTPQEVKDEARQAEGDPAIRARFRSLHRQYAMRRMMQDVATADVVITNPTHLAVALAYRPGMRAPKVIAKGARLVAERIRERGRAAGVPLVENKPLAQALYKAVPVGTEIPAALYRAVAEVLAYVWSLAGRRSGL